MSRLIFALFEKLKSCFGRGKNNCEKELVEELRKAKRLKTINSVD